MSEVVVTVLLAPKAPGDGFTLRLRAPASWSGRPLGDLIDVFSDRLEAKGFFFAGTTKTTADYDVRTADGRALARLTKVGDVARGGPAHIVLRPNGLRPAALTMAGAHTASADSTAHKSSSKKKNSSSSSKSSKSSSSSSKSSSKSSSLSLKSSPPFSEGAALLGSEGGESAAALATRLDASAVPETRALMRRAAAELEGAAAGAALGTVYRIVGRCFLPPGGGMKKNSGADVGRLDVALTLLTLRAAAETALGRLGDAAQTYRSCLDVGGDTANGAGGPPPRALRERWARAAHNYVLLLLSMGQHQGGGSRDEEDEKSVGGKEEVDRSLYREAALRVAQRAARDVGGAERHYEAGTVALQCGSDEDAIRHYRDALREDPRHCGSYVNLSSVLERRGLTADLDALAQAAVRTRTIWTHPLQRPPHWFPGLEARPWWEARVFAFTALLRASHAEIKGEFLAHVKRRRSALAEVGEREGFAHDGTLATSGTWREAVIWTARGCDEDAARNFPLTTRLVSRIGEATGCAACGAGETIFSTVEPGTRLRPHCGSTNARLTCHFGVVVPPGPTLRCARVQGTWTEGDSIVFDDSFEHDVRHDGTAPRTVLLINFWHPAFPEEWRTPDWRAHAHLTTHLAKYHVQMQHA